MAAAAIAPLHHRLTAWAEKRFQQGLVRLRRGLPVLVGDMRETASVRQIADTVAQRVEAAVRAQRVAVLVDDDPIALHGTNAAGTIGGLGSHGCIRMYNEDIMDLYGRVGVGTRIVVTR